MQIVLLSNVNLERQMKETSLWMYVVVRVNVDSPLCLVPMLQRLRASWPRARAQPPCIVSTRVHACWRHRVLPLQLPRYLHKLTSHNNHTTPTPSLGAIFYSKYRECLSFALQPTCRLQFDSLPEQRFSGCGIIRSPAVVLNSTSRSIRIAIYRTSPTYELQKQPRFRKNRSKPRLFHSDQTRGRSESVTLPL